MVEGHERKRWDHTSAILAMLANCNRDPKKRPAPYHPCDFNPFEDGRGRGAMPLTASNLNALRGFFGG